MQYREEKVAETRENEDHIIDNSAFLCEAGGRWIAGEKNWVGAGVSFFACLLNSSLLR